MSVELSPTELGFKRMSYQLPQAKQPACHSPADISPREPGPFTHEVSQILRLSNPTDQAIAFKVKTTAPKQYVSTTPRQPGHV
jgi:hypothetical protein